MSKAVTDHNYFGTERVGKILLKMAPPVMLAQLIQAFYNIADSFFVGRYSSDALTAVTVIYPVQLIIIALAVGTGVGVNTYMARKYAHDDEKSANAAAATGMVLELLSWEVFALVSFVFMRPYVMTSASEPGAVEQAVIYGRIVCLGSLGTFLEGNWSKVHQASGNMKTPMIAQVTGALINIVLDPILIFGLGPAPELGIAGAAYATVLGQIAAAVITGVKGFRKPVGFHEMKKCAGRIYYYGYSSIFMQLLFTVYIVGLNVILASFSDAAVTVLGLYYKAQSFFFIPLFGLQTCIVPILSFNYARSDYKRCRLIMRDTFAVSLAFMLVGMVCFVFFPEMLMRIFSKSQEVIEIGKYAFPIIGFSFIPAVFSLTMPVFFQAIGNGKVSMFLSLLRQIICLVPIFWLLSKIGLYYSWMSFPISETVTTVIGFILYKKQLDLWKTKN